MSVAADAGATAPATWSTRILGPYHGLRGNRDLDLLFSGQVVSSFGDWLYITALVVLAYNLTHSATLVATLTFVRLLLYAIFMPLSGVLAGQTRSAFAITAAMYLVLAGTPSFVRVL